MHASRQLSKFSTEVDKHADHCQRDGGQTSKEFKLVHWRSELRMADVSLGS
jgi:hypothetical protein